MNTVVLLLARIHEHILTTVRAMDHLELVEVHGTYAVNFHFVQL